MHSDDPKQHVSHETIYAAILAYTRGSLKLVMIAALRPAFLRESFTYDRGSEMACYVELAQKLSIDIWFADYAYL